MGSYYANGLDVKLKPDTPAAFVDFARLCAKREWAWRGDGFTEAWKEEHTKELEAFLEFCKIPVTQHPWYQYYCDGLQFFKDICATLEFWGSTFEDLPEGGYRLMTLSTNRSLDDDNALRCLLFLAPYIEFEDEKIFFRSFSPDYSEGLEHVFWFDAKSQSIIKQGGWQYGDEEEDPNHPYYHRIVTQEAVEKQFKPPRTLNEQETRELRKQLTIFVPAWDINVLLRARTLPRVQREIQVIPLNDFMEGNVE